MKKYSLNNEKIKIEEDLSFYEIEVLKALWRKQNTPYELIPKSLIVNSKNDKEHIISSIRKLVDRKFIEFAYSDETGKMKSYYRITSIGNSWMKNNL